MTEQKNSSAVVEETKAADGATPPPEKAEKNRRANRTSLALSAIAIAIALASGAGLYGWVKHQNKTLQTSNGEIADQLIALQQTQDKQRTELEGVIKQQADALAAEKRQSEALAKQLDEVQQKVATISGSDAKTWQLAQADFLVKLAGRKLWSDQDVTTAAALLKSADASLAEMNDPSLIDIRRAITEDVGTLSAVAQIDFDGIILKVNQLSNQVDDLRLADNNRDERPMDEDDGELSSSLSEWRQNLTKSWHNFMADFITVRRRDSSAEPLLAPNQDVYLRENIRSRLLVAAQAIPRHQNEVYKQSLETVSTWVRAYFDTTDPATKAFLEELDNLSQQSISMDVPGQLKSQPMLEKLMQTRVRNLLAQAPATHQEG